MYQCQSDGRFLLCFAIFALHGHHGMQFPVYVTHNRIQTLLYWEQTHTNRILSICFLPYMSSVPPHPREAAVSGLHLPSLTARAPQCTHQTSLCNHRTSHQLQSYKTLLSFYTLSWLIIHLSSAQHFPSIFSLIQNRFCSQQPNLQQAFSMMLLNVDVEKVTE